MSVTDRRRGPAAAGAGPTIAAVTVLDRPSAPSSGIPCPPPPRSAEQLGLPFSVVTDLALKVLYFNGSLLGRDLAEHLCLPFELVEPALRFLGEQDYVASSGMRGATTQAGEPLNAAMQWALSGPGRDRARELIELNQYAGPAPVPIDVYAAVARHQARGELRITRPQLRAALAHLVLSDEIMETLGPALNARHTLFVYGPPGNGKTSIADACAQLLGPPLFVPRALYAHGEIIRFFDPAYHTKVAIAGLPPHDLRWVPVQRPAVKVGGELAPHQLELTFDPRLGFYEASVQLKANGGLFLVDDFGRQTKLPTHELLNRLIVPLEKGIDYLNMARAGTNVAVPFTTTLILSTNLRPEELMDEAFLRRIRFKVLVPGPTEEQYREIWRRLCATHRIRWHADAVEWLIQHHYNADDRPFRGVHPRDLLNHVVHAAQFQERPVELSRDLVEIAAHTYFVRQLDRW